MSRKFTEQEQVRRDKIQKLMDKNISPYSKRKNYSHNSKIINEELSPLTKEQAALKKIPMSVIGRIMIKRGPFVIVQDQFGNVQGYFSKKENEELAKFIAFLDIGDIVWLSGYGMKTQTNAPTIHIDKLELLTKSLRPLPDKFHSLTNKEEKQRRRYVDLIMNPEVKARFWTRNKITKSIRKYFDDLDYFEADTPILQPILGGASALPFITKHNALSMNFYLRIATELPLKRLIVGGFDRVYEMGRLFRNEGVDASHNPEFTTIEFYEANSDLNGMMHRTEQLFKYICEELNLKTIEYQGKTINLTTSFKKITMRNIIKEKMGVDFNKVTSLEEAHKIANIHNVKYEKYHTVGHIIASFFDSYVEELIVEPTFVTEFPIEISPLAAKEEHDPLFTQRAELFIIGREYANMFTELHDPMDQHERFLAQLDEKAKGNKEATEMDLDFVEALEHGMPPTGGCGIGIDRLIMLLTNSNNINDVILFPHLKKRLTK